MNFAPNNVSGRVVYTSIVSRQTAWTASVEADAQAFGAPDPVRLHQPDLLGPALQHASASRKSSANR